MKPATTAGLGSRTDDLYRLEVGFEVFGGVAAADLGAEDAHLVHVGDDADGGATPDTAASGHEQRPARHRQHPVHSRHVLQHLQNEQSTADSAEWAEPTKFQCAHLLCPV